MAIKPCGTERIATALSISLQHGKPAEVAQAVAMSLSSFLLLNEDEISDKEYEELLVLFDTLVIRQLVRKNHV